MNFSYKGYTLVQEKKRTDIVNFEYIWHYCPERKQFVDFNQNKFMTTQDFVNWVEGNFENRKILGLDRPLDSEDLEEIRLSYEELDRQRQYDYENEYWENT